MTDLTKVFRIKLFCAANAMQMYTLVSTPQIYTHSRTKHHETSRKHWATATFNMRSIATETKKHTWRQQSLLGFSQMFSFWSLSFFFKQATFLILFVLHLHSIRARQFNHLRKQQVTKTEDNTHMLKSWRLLWKPLKLGCKRNTIIRCIVKTSQAFEAQNTVGWEWGRDDRRDLKRWNKEIWIWRLNV